MEEWKDVYGWEGFYQVSNHGRVKSLKRKWRTADIILSPGNVGGSVRYKNVVLINKENKENRLVHRLVAIHFIRYPKRGEEINHIDRNSFNNHTDNLEWVTSKENSIHSREKSRYSKQGERNPRHKVTDQQAIEIKRLRKQKIRCKPIAEQYGITVQDVLNISTRYYSHINHLV